MPVAAAPVRKTACHTEKIIMTGGQEGAEGYWDGLASLRRKRLLIGVHIHPKVFEAVAMDRRLRNGMVTMTGEQLIKLR